MDFIEVARGDSPVILGLPHTGTDLPEEVAATLNDTGRALSDTDWWIHRLYDGLLSGATTVRTRLHRYALDVNRDPSGESLYPGQNTTGLVPMTDFDGNPIWETPPDADEINRRREAYHAPYHAAMTAEIARIKAIHGYAVLYDCHSIRGRIPFLFDGDLPDFNIGTNSGAACPPEIERAVAEICAAAPGYRSILNGRFKGGWTTRHYGDPANNVHAVQMELAQRTHLTSELPPWAYDETKAARLRPHLQRILETLAAWRPQ